MTDAEAFHWLTDDQRQQLEDSQSSAWEREWPEYFGKYLDQTWPSWENEGDETRQDWVQERIQSIALGWLTPDQRTQLDPLTADRGDWREWLPRQLDEWWPDWSKAAPTELTNWFDSALPSLLPQQEAAFDARALTWVTAEQAAQLEVHTPTRGDWHQWLPLQMDTWWLDWSTAPADQLTPWLTQALPSLTPTQPTSDPRALDWLTPDQQTHLDSLTPTRGDWRQWLPLQLDTWWPGWTEAPPSQLTPWLDQALLALAPEDTSEAEAAAASGDTGVEGTVVDEITAAGTRQLDWVTDEQLVQLDELAKDRGNWHEWVPQELDQRWPGWQSEPDEVLVEWLSTVLSVLRLAPDSAADLDQVVDTFVADLLVPSLEQLDRSLVTELSQAEVEQVLAEIFEEELSEAEN
ncbi:hypothetical protein GCM10009554_57310 [Kribbella koreensis]|uniref:Uncharacterized protein n=2 Tax=Kribbella TaxID=182639 RepID=A0ABP6WQ65_9ACTN